MGMFFYTTMGIGWEWEYDHGNWRKRARKVIPAHLFLSGCFIFLHRERCQWLIGPDKTYLMQNANKMKQIKISPGKAIFKL